MSKRVSILTLTMWVIAYWCGEIPLPISPSAVAEAYSGLPQLPGFNIVRDVNVLAVRLGDSTTKTILVVPNENGGYEVALDVLGLPKGVTGSFSSNPVSVGTPVIMTLTADASGPPLQNIPITVTATRAADGAQAQLKLWLSVAAPIGQTPPSRHDVLPLSGTPTQGVFDPVRRLLFVNNPEWNRVEVIAVDRKEIVRSIPIPSPMGMDLSPDGKTVLVGTRTPQMFAIDTTSLKVVKRYVLPPPLRLSATFPAQMANGRVLLLADDGGGRSLILWDLARNSATRVPFQTLNGSVDMIRKAANGSRALLASSSSSGLIAIYDAATDRFTTHEWFGQFLSIAAVSPNGEQMVFFDDIGLAVYDPNFRLVGYLPGGAYGGPLSGAVYSPDGRRIHLVLNSYLTPTVVTADAATLRLLGTAPAIPMRPPPPIDRGPMPFEVSVPFGADATGIVYGALPHGIAYEDAAYFQNYNGQTGSPPYNNAIDPRSGPVGAATRVGFWYGNAFSFISDVWFGENRGLEPALNFPQQLSVTAPPSSRPGPVNVKLIQPNGIMVYNAQGFSYGPHILEVVGNMASPDGGATAEILALGVPNDVSQIEVKIGDNDAQVLSATRIRYDHQPVLRVRVSVPPGTPGYADVTLITPTGSLTLPKQFRYVNAVADYAPMSKYVSLTYDRFRNQLYLSATDHLDVFSLGFSSYANPIKVPSLNGKLQLGGTALTPDGSRLLVTNTADGSVAILDPDNPPDVKVVPVTEPEQFGYPPCVRGPLTIAAANNGKALIFTGSVPDAGCGPGGQLKYIDYREANLTTGPFASPLCGTAYVSATWDGSKVATGGTVYSGPGFCIYDAATDSLTNVDLYSMGAAAAGDGNVFGGAESFYGAFSDGNGEILGRPARPPEMFDSDFGVLGEIKFNGPGSLLYRPQPHFVDLFDAKRGDIRARLLLRQTIRNVIDAMALNDDGTQMYLLTDSGLTVVNIGRLPLSIGHVNPTRLVPGTQLAIRGSGFGPEMVTTLNGEVVPAAYIDSSTLQVTVPNLPSGPLDISITSSTGESYTVDNAAQIFWPLLPPREF